MPRPALRTRSRRRTRRSLPGGRKQVLHKREKSSMPRCSNCGRNISSLSISAQKLRKLGKTAKRITRLHGGKLCHICLRNSLKKATRTP